MLKKKEVFVYCIYIILLTEIFNGERMCLGFALK